MAWVYLVALALLLWGACGAVIAIGRKLWSIDTTLRVHLVAAPVFAYLLAAVHAALAPGFDPLTRGVAMTLIIVGLDALVVAPLVERSYAMFRSVIGTWLPFLAIFAAAWTAGVSAPSLTPPNRRELSLRPSSVPWGLWYAHKSCISAFGPRVASPHSCDVPARNVDPEAGRRRHAMNCISGREQIIFLVPGPRAVASPPNLAPQSVASRYSSTQPTDE